MFFFVNIFVFIFQKVPFDDKIFSSFLTTVQDEQWKRLRSIITPTFSTGKLKQMKPRIDDTIETLLANLAKTLDEK